MVSCDVCRVGEIAEPLSVKRPALRLGCRLFYTKIIVTFEQNQGDVLYGSSHYFLRATFASYIFASDRVSLALPFLEALVPRAIRAAAEKEVPRRMVCIMTNTGLIPDNFFPETPGRDYETTLYMAHLAEHRQNMTLIGGVCIRIAAAHGGKKLPDRHVFLHRLHSNSISLDQLVVEELGHHTRFPFLALGDE